MADLPAKPSRSQPLKIGRTEVRPFRDYVVPNPGRTSNGEQIGFIPGGSYERGRFPGLDQELDRLKEGPNPTPPRKQAP